MPARSRASLEESLNGSDSQTPLLGRMPVQQQHPASYLHRIRQNHLVDAILTVLFSNYVNVLLIFLPLGIISGALDWAPPVVFGFNFLAIMPLAALLSFATEELSKEVGQTIGGLLNASFGNATELIVSIVALKEGQIRLVQASMLGSILSNLLLVLSIFLASTNVHSSLHLLIQGFGMLFRCWRHQVP
jgi:Ca2+:H+ antiporter